METALYQSKVVTVGVFQRIRKSRNDHASCPGCGEVLFVSAAASVKKTASFNHRKRQLGEEHCPLSYPYHPSYSWLPEAPEGAVDARAEALKRQFYEKENLQRAFVFLVNLTGKGAMSSAVFALLLNKANKLGIWNYAEMPIWAVPYILLTLTDFVVRPKAGMPERIRFVIDKPLRSELKTTWLTPGQCSLARLPVQLGRVNSAKQQARTRPMIGTYKIPLAFSETIFLDLTKDTSWLHENLKNLFEEMEMEPLDEDDELEAQIEAVLPAYPPSRVSEAKGGGSPHALPQQSKEEPSALRRATAPPSADGQPASGIPVKPLSPTPIKVALATDQVVVGPTENSWPEKLEARKPATVKTQNNQPAPTLKTTLQSKRVNKPSPGGNIQKTWQRATDALRRLFSW
ncbi:hypothetical protein [Duganella sp. S19_KUP01_CR8]|uniref:hypothetical protein n=1 Tax=Duganella sp. S19_KUP01_CR8 TaxID=3025502 RepID=UPI002FCD891C